VATPTRSVEDTAAWDARPTTPGRARSVVAGVLERAGHDEITETALLLTSELVTNAVVHARGPVSIRVRCDDHRLRVEVRDRSSVAPRRLEVVGSAVGGRGLRLVDALATDWGDRCVPGGKIVWFDLALG
jgi:anti-sigma regulatory factor (Ser/Thr protein kinase)